MHNFTGRILLRIVDKGIFAKTHTLITSEHELKNAKNIYTSIFLVHFPFWVSLPGTNEVFFASKFKIPSSQFPNLPSFFRFCRYFSLPSYVRLCLLHWRILMSDRGSFHREKIRYVRQVSINFYLGNTRTKKRRCSSSWGWIFTCLGSANAQNF